MIPTTKKFHRLYMRYEGCPMNDILFFIFGEEKAIARSETTQKALDHGQLCKPTWVLRSEEHTSELQSPC